MDFFMAVWNLWNWEDIADRFARAGRADLALEDVAEETTAAAAP
jgi:hypothetical protein